MMKRVLTPATAVLCLPALLAAADFDRAGSLGPHEVETRLGVWVDEARGDRDIPWKLFLPKGLVAPAPAVVFSPGGGGARDDAAGYLGEHLASHGFASFHLQHRGSDADALKRLGAPALFEAIRNSSPSWAVLRQQDILLAVDRIERLAENELAGKIDAGRLGMSGFSFGGVTTLITAGQKYPGLGQGLAEPRFRAAFALSPSPRHGIAAPVLPREEAAKIYQAMLMPVFHLTGTHDATPFPSVTSPEQRRMPFELISNVEQYLLVLNDAVHATFGGRDLDHPAVARHRGLIKQAAVVFWRAYLLGDQAALAYLRGGGYASAVGSAGRFEHKPPR